MSTPLKAGSNYKTSFSIFAPSYFTQGKEEKNESERRVEFPLGFQIS